MRFVIYVLSSISLLNFEHVLSNMAYTSAIFQLLIITTPEDGLYFWI